VPHHSSRYSQSHAAKTAPRCHIAAVVLLSFRILLPYYRSRERLYQDAESRKRYDPRDSGCERPPDRTVVQKEYGFIPHPFWIRHCKELYIQGPRLPVEGRRPWHECPLDKRPAIKAAFFYFGMLSQ
jgi:hypothetical protein